MVAACVTLMQVIAVGGPLFVLCVVLAMLVWIKVLDGPTGVRRLVRRFRSETS